MKAIILAGGLGTRLRGVIDETPKPMAPVGGKPFLEYLLSQLKRWGFDDVILSVGYKKEAIRSHFGDGHSFGLRVSYCEEDDPLGTGGALKKAILMHADSAYIVLNGDSFFDIDFSDLIAFHKNKPGIATMSLTFVRDQQRYGSVEINKTGRIASFIPKGQNTPGLINGGIYLVDRDIVTYMPEGPTSLERDVLPLIMKDRLLYGKVFDAFFLDMGIPKDYFWIDQHPEHLF